jgi:four helix bundle protein
VTETKSYRDLDVWALSMDLAVKLYRTTSVFPASELYGMTTQIRRASVSIPANIAEGYGRETTAYFIQFLRVSQGSVKELETHLLLAERVGLISPENAKLLLADTDRIARMLRNLIRSLQAKERAP